VADGGKLVGCVVTERDTIVSRTDPTTPVDLRELYVSAC
jgi:hypothetical protein